MAMDLSAAGSHVLAGSGGGTGPADPFTQEVFLGGQPAAIPLGYYRVTTLGAAVNLPSIPAGAVSADIAIEGANVRWRDDGQSPTASVGMPLAQDASMIYRGNLAAIQFIQQSVGAILNVSYYK